MALGPKDGHVTKTAELLAGRIGFLEFTRPPDVHTECGYVVITGQIGRAICPDAD